MSGIARSPSEEVTKDQGLSHFKKTDALFREKLQEIKHLPLLKIEPFATFSNTNKILTLDSKL